MFLLSSFYYGYLLFMCRSKLGRIIVAKKQENLRFRKKGCEKSSLKVITMDIVGFLALTF